MIRILGLKRIIILTVLIAVNLLLAGLMYLYFVPQGKKEQLNLQTLQGEINNLQSDISRMKIEYDEIQKEKERFQSLESDGFFRDQSRREAEDLLKRIQVSSNVLSAVINIGSGQIMPNAEADKASHKILQSTVKLEIESVDDVDIYRYLYMMQRHFPGYLTFESFQMQRVANIDATILRGIASGKITPLVKAEIDMSWQTMIPDAMVQSDKSAEDMVE